MQAHQERFVSFFVRQAHCLGPVLKHTPERRAGRIWDLPTVTEQAPPPAEAATGRGIQPADQIRAFAESI